MIDLVDLVDQYMEDERKYQESLNYMNYINENNQIEVNIEDSKKEYL
jgi:hypothetical protein